MPPLTLARPRSLRPVTAVIPQPASELGQLLAARRAHLPAQPSRVAGYLEAIAVPLARLNQL